MNNLHIKGALNQTKGKIKENIGHITGKESTEAKGFGQRIKGKLQTIAGNLKDKVKETADRKLDRAAS